MFFISFENEETKEKFDAALKAAGLEITGVPQTMGYYWEGVVQEIEPPAEEGKKLWPRGACR